MSNRTIIEFNHDYFDRIISQEFLKWLTVYLNSCDSHAAEMLGMLGATVHGTSHHSDKPWADVIKDGKK
jgi:hypothetical protein